MSKFIIKLLLVLSLVYSNSCYAENLLIKWHQSSDQSAYIEGLELQSAQQNEHSFSVYRFHDNFSRSQRLQLIRQLQHNPKIRWATLDQQATAQLVPDDPLYPEQDSWMQLIQQPPTWDRTSSCQDVVIAIVDSGIDLNHEDLQANLWVNAGEIANNGIDDDGNGYVDDLHGWNLINDNHALDDRYGHGTHVAGIIGATANNQLGVAGICWTTHLMSVKFLDSFGSGSLAHAAQAIDYILTLKDQYPEYRFIINNSWTAPYNVALEEAFQRAIDSGVLIVNAAGNSGKDIDASPIYPASWSLNNLNSITVANLDNEASPLKLNVSSNYGLNTVTIAAPGTNILSTWPTSLEPQDSENANYEFKDGTSMSTPVISAVAALLWQQNPNLNAQEVRAVLEKNVSTADQLRNQIRTAGFINAEQTLNYFDQDVASLGYLVFDQGSWQIKGVNLDLVTSLQLNDANPLFANPAEDTLELIEPAKLRCGNLGATLEDGTQTNNLYLDLKPASPQSLRISQNSDGSHTLSWNSDANVDAVEIQLAGSDGNFSHLETVTNDTQTALIEGLNDDSRIRVRSIMQCYDANNQAVDKISDFSAELLLADITVPNWQNTQLSTPILNQAYFQNLNALDADSYRLSAQSEQLTEPRCIPEGLALEANHLTGTVSTPQDCHFDIIATNQTSNASSILSLHFAVDQTTDYHIDAVSLQADSPISAASLRQLSTTQWQLEIYQSSSLAANHILINSTNPSVSFVDAHFDIAQAATTEANNLIVSSNLIDATFAKEDLYQQTDNFDSYRLLITTNDSANLAQSSHSDNRCFIASSIYHSHRHPKVQALREIRDWALQTLPGAHWLVEQYYAYSPPAVEWMQQHPQAASWINTAIQLNLEMIIWAKSLFSGESDDA